PARPSALGLPAPRFLSTPRRCTRADLRSCPVLSRVGLSEAAGEQPEERQPEAPVAGAALPRPVRLAGTQVLVAAVRAVERGRPAAHDRASSEARAAQTANRSPSSRSAWKRFRTRSM